MNLLVALGDLALLVDPELRVFEFRGVGVIAGFVDTDRDGKRVLFGKFLEAEDEWRFADWPAEAD